jgi:hypothetical protein
MVVALLRRNGQRSVNYRGMSAEQKNCARFVARLDWVPAAGLTQPVVSDDGVCALNELATAVATGVLCNAVGVAKGVVDPAGTAQRNRKRKRKAAKPNSKRQESDSLGTIQLTKVGGE